MRNPLGFTEDGAILQQTRQRRARIGDSNSGCNSTDIELNLHRASLSDAFSTADLYEELEERWTEAWAHLHRRSYRGRCYRAFEPQSMIISSGSRAYGA